MDLSETTGEVINRHPWELSRTQCTFFMIRFVQKMLHLSIDPEHKFTANWNYAEEHFVTRFLTVCLNLDFLFNRLFSKIGIRFPGLSMLVICKKTG